jgi:DnaJ-class molecular chaperone
MEFAYYSSKFPGKDPSLCEHCATAGAVVDPQLKTMWKTVLPICGSCDGIGKVEISVDHATELERQQ